MKKYPKIYSLSTVGVIYHFNADYKFHELRTDFSGEGGSGKTMVADMVQLILVGPELYRSATEGNKDRPIEGLVAGPKSEYAASYIILNVEISPKKYIAIGSFIERSSKHGKMFIVQSGFDWDTLEPLDTPAYSKDFLLDGKIAPFEQFENSTAQFQIKSFTTKQYHEILYDNGILGVNLAESKKTLKSFVRIFRSFSRGSGFKTDSSSLKNFLFGDDGKVLLEKYNSEVKSISEDFQEHERYRSEIETITKKQQHIKDIVELERNKNQLQEQYLTEKVQYWDFQIKKLQGIKSQLELRWKQTKVSVLKLEIKNLEFRSNEIRNNVTRYVSAKQKLKNSPNKLSPKNPPIDHLQMIIQLDKKQDDVEIAKKWCGQHDNELTQVHQSYLEHRDIRLTTEMFERFKSSLIEAKLLSDFESIDWTQTLDSLKDSHKTLLASEICKLEELVALDQFSDIDNPNSLAYWAINNLKRALSIEEESALVHFQLYPQTLSEKPKQGDRALTSPEAFLKNFATAQDVSGGFWLELGGTQEFIVLVKKQLLNTEREDSAEFVQNVKQLRSGLNEKINVSKTVINKLQLIQKLIFDHPELGLIKETLNESSKRLHQDASMDISEARFNEIIVNYQNRELIAQELEVNKKLHEQSLRNSSSSDLSHYEREVRETEAFFKEEDIRIAVIEDGNADWDEELRMRREELNSLSSSHNLSNDLLLSVDSELNKIDLKTRLKVVAESAKYDKALSQTEDEISSHNTSFSNAEDKLRMSLQEYELKLRRKWVNESYELTGPMVDPDEEGENSLRQKFHATKLRFEERFNLLVDQLENSNHLKDTFHVGQLAHRMLPTVFTTASSLDTTVQADEMLGKRLSDLHQLVMQIGSRKIEILKRVFTEVNQTYREYLDKVTKIDLYFKNPSKQITGGTKAALKYEQSSDYPPRWLTVFNRLLDDQLGNVGLFEQLSQEIDINEMMKKAFILEGGSASATIEDMLNPKSYFDLNFDLRLESGETNAGSNSQTYSGNALLGLARLSLIEDPKQKGIKIMPIDEAQGLGSNYEMLRNIAIDEDYQLLTMSIETAGEIRNGEQYIYILSENSLSDLNNYVPAFGIFNDNVVVSDIRPFVEAHD